nr:MAG TPA: hypothetical protein [Caudoviricetes sp.]
MNNPPAASEQTSCKVRSCNKGNHKTRYGNG